MTRLVGPLLMLFLAGGLAAQDFPSEQLHPEGRTVPKANRINVVFLSDGYPDEEMDRYKRRCGIIVKGLLEQTPYKEYARFFTFTRIDNRPPASPRREAVTGGAMDPDWNKMWAINPQLPRHVVVTLVNGWYPGSACYGKFVLLSEANSNGGLIALLSHELGHALGRLLDEDSVESRAAKKPLPPESRLPANLTREPDPGKVKWKPWIEAKLVGNPVAGGMGRAAGIYRPKDDCRMRYGSAAPFCEVCVEEHIRRLYTHVSLLEPWKPEEEVITAPGAGQPVTVSVSCVGPTPDTSVIGEWSLDGRLLEGAGTQSAGADGPRFEVVLDGARMTPGTHDLKFVATDNTTLVKDAKQDDPVYRRRPNIRKWAIRVPAPALQLTPLRVTATSMAE